MNHIKYNISLISQKTYSLVIYGVSQVLSWVENFGVNFGFIIYMYLGVYFSGNVGIVNGITSSIRSMLRVTSNNLMDFSFKVLSISQLSKLVTDNTYKINLVIISPLFRTLRRLFSTMDSSMGISAAVVVATLLKLGIYDPQDLGDMDTQTLGDLDSVIVT